MEHGSGNSTSQAATPSSTSAAGLQKIGGGGGVSTYVSVKGIGHLWRSMPTFLMLAEEAELADMVEEVKRLQARRRGTRGGAGEFTSVSQMERARIARRRLRCGVHVPFPLIGAVIFLPELRKKVARTMFIILTLAYTALGLFIGIFVMAPLVIPFALHVDHVPKAAWERARHNSVVGCFGLLFAAGCVTLHAANAGVFQGDIHARDDDDDDDDDIYGNLNGSKKLKMKNKYASGADEEDISSPKPSANAEGASQSQSLARLYRDAVNIVASYSFTLGEDETETQALVPFWDMLNHTHPVFASVKLSHDASTKRLNMIAVRDIRKGDEILNTYGELSDGELLRRYGFLPTSSRNPHNSITISFKELFTACDKVYGFENPRLVRKKVLKLTNENWRSRFEVYPNGRPSRKLIAIADAIFSVEDDDDEEDEAFELEKKDTRAKEITEALNFVAIRALTPGNRYPTARREASKSIQMLLDADSRAKRSEVNFLENHVDRRRIKMALRVRLSELKTFSMMRKWLRMGKLRKWLF